MSSANIDTLGLPIVDSLLPSSLDGLTPLLKLSSIDHPLNPNVTAHYSIEFGFERLFESRAQVDKLNAWMRVNWKLSFVFAALYIVLIVLGRYYMSSRPRFELRKPLLAWNLFLAVFSIAGSIRTWPEFVYAVFGRGIVYSVCDISYAYSITGFWAFLFIMSKLPELVDTLFIVLRKQELIFLHYYHHATVLIYCWYSYSDFAASGRWFMCMNYVVHSIMYSYYALKAMRVAVPMAIAKLITFLQIVQMFFGCYVNWVAYSTKKHSPETPCNITEDNIFWSFLMYLSYFALFAHFFINAYLKANARHKLKRQQMELEKKKQAAEAAAAAAATTNGHSNGSTDVKKTN